MSTLEHTPPGNGYLVVPCAPSDFGSFIAGLLGRPRITRGVISGFLDVGAKEVANFFHLINQRVTTQNEGSLVNFSITTLYNNGTSETHQNAKDFESYYPLSKCYPVEVVLSFTYLIKFKNRDLPEKQEIDINISVDRDHPYNLRGAHWTHTGVCRYEIKNTDSSWAADIANIITSHAESIIEQPGKIRHFFSGYYDDILRHGTSVIYIIVAILWLTIFNGKAEASANPNELFTVLANGAVIFIVLSSALNIVTTTIFMNINLRRTSFISLVDKDYTRRDKIKRSESRGWMFYIGSWVINIMCSIVASYVFLQMT